MTHYIPLKRRSWFGRLFKIPALIAGHYAIFRKHSGRLFSAWWAVRLAFTVVISAQWQDRAIIFLACLALLAVGAIGLYVRLKLIAFVLGY